MNAAPEKLLTVEDVAFWLDYHAQHVRRLAREGKLPAFKVGGVWRFRRSELEEWLEAQGEGRRG